MCDIIHVSNKQYSEAKPNTTCSEHFFSFTYMSVPKCTLPKISSGSGGWQEGHAPPPYISYFMFLVPLSWRRFLNPLLQIRSNFHSDTG